MVTKILLRLTQKGCWYSVTKKYLRNITSREIILKSFSYTLEYFDAIDLIGLIPLILFNIAAWYIADQGHEDIVAIDTKAILLLGNKELSPKYYVERYHFEIFQLNHGVFLRDSPDWTYSSNII